MANTFTQIYIQVVFAVEWRQALIRPENKEGLHKYITGIVRNKGRKMIAINSRPDHLHMLVGMEPDIALSDLVREVKKSSTGFINANRWVKGRFNWQAGFGGFSYSRSSLLVVFPETMLGLSGCTCSGSAKIAPCLNSLTSSLTSKPSNPESSTNRSSAFAFQARFCSVQ